MPDYVRCLGFSADLLPSRTFQGTPMRHRGAHVGNFYLVDKQGGGAFTEEDEEVLVLLASQATTAIANARTYRDERRARAGLEALIDISPVGVVVFEAGTGDVVSVSREATRIVESLCMPGQPVEQLLGIITCRRADGREIALDRLPLAVPLGSAETVRAEEIVLSVPDGRRVTTFINATPIHGDDGTVASVVVTLQDMAPFEELGRMRAEFLGMVSHELRAPLTSIKGSAATVLHSARVFNPAEVKEFFRIIDEQANHMDGLIGDLLDAGRIATGALSVSPEPSDIAMLVDEARTTFLTGGTRHTVLIDLAPDLPRVRRGPPAHRAGAEQPALERRPPRAEHLAHPDRGRTRRGRCRRVGRRRWPGLAPERLTRMFQQYAGDAEYRIGNGLGLAICKGLVEAHGGRIWAESGGLGLGSCFTFTVPVAENAGSAAPGLAAAAPEGHEPARILVLDDDPLTLRYVRDTLRDAGYTSLVTGDPRELPRLLESETPDLLLLDLVLPGIDGIELMENEPRLADLPVIFISGYGRDETIVRALQAGAYDYIVKPFSPTELVARIGAALRRHGAPELFVLGDLTIDHGRRRVTVGGNPVELTPTEYELLRALSLNAGRVSTHESLLRRVWSKRNDGDPKIVRAYVKLAAPQARRRRPRPRLYSQPSRRGLPHARPGGTVAAFGPRDRCATSPRRRPRCEARC